MTATGKITPGDIRAKFQELQASTDAPIEEAKNTAVRGVAIAVGVIVIGAFLLGRRRGKKRRTIVEIRRV
jgi:hypothetical protein